MTEQLCQLGYGEIVSWRVPKEAQYADIISGLNKHSLPTHVAHKLQPRNAFIRGVRQLEDKRLVRKVSDDANSIKFQMNKIEDAGGAVNYPYETDIVMEKSTGNVTCADKQLESKVQVLLYQELGRRTSGDITKIIQKIFEDAGSELIPIRDQGGAYFVPAHLVEVADRVRDFLGDIGGSIKRFGGLSGSNSQASLAESVEEYFEDLIREFRQQIEKLNEDSSDHVRQRRSDRVEELRLKLRTYSDLLSMNSEHIDQQISLIEREMIDRLNGVIGVADNSSDAEPQVDFIGEHDGEHDDHEESSDQEEPDEPLDMLAAMSMSQN